MVHIRKMTTESAQILSTVHRLLDGTCIPTYVMNKHGVYKLNKKFYRHHTDTIVDDHLIDHKLYRATHTGHPSVIWCTASVDNYEWLYTHFKALSELFECTTSKPHGAWVKTSESLYEAPSGIAKTGFTEPPKCMPEHVAGMYSSVIKCYKQYLKEKYKNWLDRVRPVKVEYPHLKQLPKWLEA